MSSCLEAAIEVFELRQREQVIKSYFIGFCPKQLRNSRGCLNQGCYKGFWFDHWTRGYYEPLTKRDWNALLYNSVYRDRPLWEEYMTDTPAQSSNPYLILADRDSILDD